MRIDVHAVYFISEERSDEACSRLGMHSRQEYLEGVTAEQWEEIRTDAVVISSDASMSSLPIPTVSEHGDGANGFFSTHFCGFMHFRPWIVARQEAAGVVRGLDLDLLPIATDLEEVFLLRPRHVLSGLLDVERSDGVEVMAGRVADVEHPVFVRGMDLPDMFVLDEFPRMRTYVNQRFVDALGEECRSGLVLREIEMTG